VRASDTAGVPRELTPVMLTPDSMQGITLRAFFVSLETSSGVLLRCQRVMTVGEERHIVVTVAVEGRSDNRSDPSGSSRHIHADKGPLAHLQIRSQRKRQGSRRNGTRKRRSDPSSAYPEVVLLPSPL
jgi:hypothetical protein